MTLNITSGEELNRLLAKENEIDIPFNEAMEKGSFAAPPFSSEFMKERAAVHGTTIQDYQSKMSPFIQALRHLNDYESIQLWFGEEPFCRANTRFVLSCLRKKRYKGRVILNIVDERTAITKIFCRIDLFAGERDVQITALKQAEWQDLSLRYENPMPNACFLNIGDTFLSKNGTFPKGMCPSAWMNLEIYVYLFALGGFDFFCGWMKNPWQAMVSCNDGFRPVTFLLESVKAK